MPTTRPRHSITETPRVQDALDRLRRRGERIDLADLVVRGAEQRLAEIVEEPSAAERRRRFVVRMTEGDGIDLEVLATVREKGWTRG